MSDALTELMATRVATSNRPLLGLTVLVVEDSRFACEAMRLLCLRSGARIRRADCLRSAHRHLQTYRPGVVIVDLGLPDGSGADLIETITGAAARTSIVLGTSGDPEGEAVAMAAGANGFLPKPIESLAAFQAKILAALPSGRRPLGPRAVPEERIAPDPLALRDDLSHAADVLAETPEGATLDYIAKFVGGLARSAHDEPLEAAAKAVMREARSGTGAAPGLARLNNLLRDRLTGVAAF